MYTWRAVQKDLEKKGVTCSRPAADEVPGVYKNIHEVMAAAAGSGRNRRPVRPEDRQDVRRRQQGRGLSGSLPKRLNDLRSRKSVTTLGSAAARVASGRVSLSRRPNDPSPRRSPLSSGPLRTVRSTRAPFPVWEGDGSFAAVPRTVKYGQLVNRSRRTPPERPVLQWERRPRPAQARSRCNPATARCATGAVLTVGSTAVPVEQPKGQIAGLLYLRQQHPFSQRIDRSRRDQYAVTSLNRKSVKAVFDPPVAGKHSSMNGGQLLASDPRKCSLRGPPPG